MEIRPRPAAQNPGRMLGSGMNPEDWIELTKRTECNCECVGQSFVMTPEDQREDFVKVGVEIGDRRYAETGFFGHVEALHADGTGGAQHGDILFQLVTLR